MLRKMLIRWGGLERMGEGIEKLNEEKKTLNDKMKKIKKRKLELEEEIKNKKNIKKEKPRETNHVNKLIRVSRKFDEKIENINNKREENGFDKLSKPKITELVVMHNKYWPAIEEDIINFNKDVEGEND